jgi:CBS domain-containing protein
MVTLHDIMSMEVVTVSPEASLRDVAELLADRHISGVPVVANGRVLGVVSATDLLEFDAAGRGVPRERPEQMEWGSWPDGESWVEGEEAPSTYFADMWDNAGADVRTRLLETQSPEWNVLEEHAVSEVMTRSLCCLSPETGIPDAAEYMLRAGVHRILVARDERLVGMVTTTDIVKAVSQYGLGA